MKFGRSARALQAAVLFMLAMIAASAYSASKTVLVLGDSLSAEYGLTRGTGWVPLLERRLNAEKIDAHIINASISGETTSGGKTRLPALLERYRPDILIIELGANDGLRGLPVASAKANLHAMIETARGARAKILLVGMRIPPNYGRDYTEKLSSMYMELARDLRVPLVPFLLEGVADKPQLFQSDRLHPLAEAQAAILDNIWPHLKPLLLKQSRR